MNVYEMHVLFRTLTQQQGLQRVRAILPETIDTFLQQGIIHIVQTELQVGANKVFKENVASQQAKVSLHNALSTLVSNTVIDINLSGEFINLDKDIPNILYLTDFAISKDNRIFVKCRWIENDRLEDTMNDYCNRDSERNPIVTVTSTNDIGRGEPYRLCSLFTGGNNHKFKHLRVGYVRTPATVHLVGKDSPMNVDCDLPAYLHTNVVETAMELFMLSLGLTSNKQQASESGKQLQ